MRPRHRILVALAVAVAVTVVAVAALVVAMWWGWAPPPAQPKDLQFTVAVSNEPAGLRLIGTVATTRILPREVVFGVCAMRVRVYREPGRAGPAVWDSDLSGYLCSMSLISGPISRVFPAALRPHWTKLVSSSDLPSDTPEGTYYATASVSLDGPRMESTDSATQLT